MRTTLLAMVVPFLFCVFGCARAPWLPEPEREPVFPEEVKPPESPHAKALDGEENVIYLHINEQGELVMPSDERYKDSTGNETTHLDSIERIEIYLKRKAKEDERRAGPENKDARSLIRLRVDARTPFEKTYAILKACRSAGYTKFQLQVIRPEGGEGQIPFAAGKADEKTVKFTAQVTADAKGSIEKITLRGEGIEKELDFKADIDAFTKKLKELTAKNKDKRPALLLEVDKKLLQGELVKLIDGAISAGINDVSPVPLDPKKR